MKLEDRFWSKVRKGPDCWEWLAARGKNPSGSLGYGQFSIGSRVDKDRRMHAAHRVAWSITNGEIPVGLNVLHRCDNQACVNPEHLFLGTQRDNVSDMIAKGRKRPAVGDRHGSAKLTEDQVRKIRQEYTRGTSRFNPGNKRELAIEFGVRPSTITDVALRGWSHVK